MRTRSRLRSLIIAPLAAVGIVLTVMVGSAGASTARPAVPARCTAQTLTTHSNVVETNYIADSCGYYAQAWGEWSNVYHFGLWIRGTGPISVAGNGTAARPSEGGDRWKTCSTCAIHTDRTFGSIKEEPPAPPGRIFTRAFERRSCSGQAARAAPAAWSWMVGCSSTILHYTQAYCVYPFGRHNYLNGPTKRGNGSINSNYSQVSCTTYGVGNPYHVWIWYNAGAGWREIQAF